MPLAPRRDPTEQEYNAAVQHVIETAPDGLSEEQFNASVDALLDDPIERTKLASPRTRKLLESAESGGLIGDAPQAVWSLIKGAGKPAGKAVVKKAAEEGPSTTRKIMGSLAKRGSTMAGAALDPTGTGIGAVGGAKLGELIERAIVGPKPSAAAMALPTTAESAGAQLAKTLTKRAPQPTALQQQMMPNVDRYLGRTYDIAGQNVQIVGMGPDGVSLRALDKGTKLAKSKFSWPEWSQLFQAAVEQ